MNSIAEILCITTRNYVKDIGRIELDFKSLGVSYIQNASMDSTVDIGVVLERLVDAYGKETIYEKDIGESFFYTNERMSYNHNKHKVIMADHSIKGDGLI